MEITTITLRFSSLLTVAISQHTTSSLTITEAYVTVESVSTIGVTEQDRGISSFLPKDVITHIVSNGAEIASILQTFVIRTSLFSAGKSVTPKLLVLNRTIIYPAGTTFADIYKIP